MSLLLQLSYLRSMDSPPAKEFQRVSPYKSEMSLLQVSFWNLHVSFDVTFYGLFLQCLFADLRTNRRCLFCRSLFGQNRSLFVKYRSLFGKYRSILW